MLVQIFTYPAAVKMLRRRAEPMPASAFGTARLYAYGDTLGLILVENENRPSLAATQVDFVNVRSVIAVAREMGSYSILYNPKVVSSGPEVIGPEQCLSFPGVTYEVKAPVEILVEYQDHDGKPHQRPCKAGMARHVWRAIRYLDGKLPIDMMNESEKRQLERNLERWRREGDAEVAS